MKKNHFVHSSSFVDREVTIGRGTRIWYFCHISADASIGKNCNIGQNVFIDRGVTIGDNVKIQNNVSVYRGVEIGDGAFLGPSCVFTNVRNPRALFPRSTEEYLTTKVGEGASIGANATIVCGNTIGAHSFIGAGAVVTRNVPAHAIVIGNPARCAGWMCRCGGKLEIKKGSGACKTCGARYRKGKECIETIR